MIKISSKTVQTNFILVVGWTDRQTDELIDKEKIGLFILAITFDLNYKINQINIMYMYLI